MTLIIVLNSILAVAVVGAITTGHLWAILTSDAAEARAAAPVTPNVSAPLRVAPRPAIA